LQKDKAEAPVVSNNYWSSTENSSTNAYNLNFNNGSVNNNNKTNSNYIRCVKGHQFLIRFAAKNKMQNSDQLPIYNKSYQLIRFLHERVRSFPKEYKYTIGEEILRLSWRCVDLVIEANVLPNNKKYLKISELSCSFDQLKIRLRLAQEIGLMSIKQFTHICIYFLKEIGEMIGGWLNWSKGQKYE